MRQKNRDLTKGTPWKVLLLYSFPIILGSVFQLVYNMTDTIIVGNLLGLNALGAVGSTGSTTFLISGFSSGLASGFAVPVAQAFGSGDRKLMRHYVGLYSVWMGILTVIITAVSVCCCHPLLRALNTPENIYQDTYNYLIVILFGMLFTMLYNGCANILRAVGDSKTPLYFLIISTIVNVFLDILLIKKTDLGVMAASVATSIAQLLSGLLCLFYIKKKIPFLKLSREDFRIDKNMTLKMFKIGFPMAFQFAITAIGSMILQASVNSFGSEVLGAQTASSKVESVGNMAFWAVSSAISTYAAQNVGANAPERVIRGTKSGLALIMLSTLIAMFVYVVPSEAILHLFVKDISVEAMTYAHIFLNLQAVFMPALGILVVYRGVLQGAGIAIAPMLGGFMECISRIAVCVVANNVAVDTITRYRIVCLATPAAWIFAGGLCWIRYQFYKRDLKEQIRLKNAH